MPDPIMVTHTPSSSVLRVEWWSARHEFIDVRLVGGQEVQPYPASELEFPPTPRPLPTHVGAIIRLQNWGYFDFDGDAWIGVESKRRYSPKDFQRISVNCPDWVELVPKTGDGA
jgi:hypothetical protein